MLAVRHGITDVLLLTGHAAHYIEDYFGTGQRWGVAYPLLPRGAAAGNGRRRA